MDAYIYRAALLCAHCGRDEQSLLRSDLKHDTGDSDDFPQGPYPNGGGEADSPQHCDMCGEFLENPLTGDGYEYVKQVLAGGRALREQLAEAERVGQGRVQRQILAVHEQWQRFYEIVV